MGEEFCRLVAASEVVRILNAGFAVLLVFGLFDVANSVTQGFDMYRILTIYSDPFTHNNTIFLFRFNTGFRNKTKHIFCYLSRASIT